MTQADASSSDNSEATEAWDGPLYDRFVRFRDIVIDRARRRTARRRSTLFPPQPGQRVLDIGCGFGDTTQRIAGMVGPEGEAVRRRRGARFIEAARARDRRGGRRQRRASRSPTCRPTSSAAPTTWRSRASGTMFFASPVAALRNMREALVPGGRLVMVVWRRRERQRLAVPRPADRRGLVRAPGGVRRADLRPRPVLDGRRRHVSDMLLHAGFTDIELHRCDLPIAGRRRDVERGDRARHGARPGRRDPAPRGRPRGAPARRGARGAARGPRRVRDARRRQAPASTWIVSAVNPG